MMASLMLLSFSISSFEAPELPNVKELECMATNIYREARGEPVEGQIAVGSVVLNRVDDPRYPKTACAVIYQRNQFSWTNKFKGVKYSIESMNSAIQAYSSRNTEATHFHTTSVKPKWANKKSKTIGNHKFYAL